MDLFEALCKNPQTQLRTIEPRTPAQPNGIPGVDHNSPEFARYDKDFVQTVALEKTPAPQVFVSEPKRVKIRRNNPKPKQTKRKGPSYQQLANGVLGLAAVSALSIMLNVGLMATVLRVIFLGDLLEL